MSRPAEIARAWALSQVGHPYLYGGTGQPCTVAYRKARAAQYPASADKIRRNCPRMAGSASSCEGCRWYDPQEKIGKTAYDCAQLTRWCMNAAGISLASGATSQWTKTAWAEKGALSQMPLDRLCLVYRQDSASVMGHAGIYLGDGTVVHAKGHAEGVVREQLNEGHRFTHYAIPQGLYGAADIFGHGPGRPYPGPAGAAGPASRSPGGVPCGRMRSKRACPPCGHSTRPCEGT